MVGPSKSALPAEDGSALRVLMFRSLRHLSRDEVDAWLAEQEGAAEPGAAGVAGLRVGVVRELTAGVETQAEVRAAVEAAAARLGALGATVEEVSLPLLPLAGALRERGHEVAFATHERWHGHIAAAGYPAFEAGTSHAEARLQLEPYREEIAALPPLERRPHIYPRLFGRGHAPPKLPGLLRAGRVEVGHDETVEERAAGGDRGHRPADTPGTDQQDAHVHLR